MKIENQFGINKFFKISLSVLFFFINYDSFCQNDINIDTYYKNNPTLNFTEERFSFSFLAKEKLLIKNDIDLNVIKQYPIEFFDSSYSKDGKYYLIAYITDINRINENESQNFDLGMFFILYDKKNGEILAVKIKLKENELYDFYLTKKGREVLKFEND